jgi:hypothetical protein
MTAREERGVRSEEFSVLLPAKRPLAHLLLSPLSSLLSR